MYAKGIVCNLIFKDFSAQKVTDITKKFIFISPSFQLHRLLYTLHWSALQCVPYKNVDAKFNQFLSGQFQGPFFLVCCLQIRNKIERFICRYLAWIGCDAADWHHVSSLPWRPSDLSLYRATICSYRMWWVSLFELSASTTTLVTLISIQSWYDNINAKKEWILKLVVNWFSQMYFSRITLANFCGICFMVIRLTRVVGRNEEFIHVELAINQKPSLCL